MKREEKGREKQREGEKIWNQSKIRKYARKKEKRRKAK